MTQQEYNIKKQMLQSIVTKIPSSWGAVQNDASDGGINMFAINDYTTLISSITHLIEEQQQYLQRRWFLWQCSICDEYLFCINRNVKPNPDSKSKDYDIQFNNDEYLQFDIKGTVVPKQFREDVDELIKDPQPLIDFYYQKQSKQVRYGEQNRLFVIHHSYRNENRELILRAHFDFKQEAFKRYAMQTLLGKKYLNYKNAKADALFVFENEDKSFTYKF
jgi:hypothetical protein